MTLAAGQTITVNYAVKSGEPWHTKDGKGPFQSWEVNVEGEGNTTYQINTKADNELIAPKTGLVKAVYPNDSYPDRLQMDWNPEKSGSYSGGGGSGGQRGGHEYQRSKEQCMRGEAAIAAAYVASNLEDLFEKAEEIYKWIKGDDEPQAQGPSLDEMRNDLAAWAQASSVTMASVASAIKAVTGEDKLTVGADLDAIKSKAASLENEQIPF